MPKPLPVNLLELKPLRNSQWEAGEQEELVVLLVPRFSDPFLGRWLMPRLRSPMIRIKLDAVGSFVWSSCDGSMTVLEIAERLKERFGDSVEPLYERIGMFVRRLQRDSLVTIDMTVRREADRPGAGPSTESHT